MLCWMDTTFWTAVGAVSTFVYAIFTIFLWRSIKLQTDYLSEQGLSIKEQTAYLSKQVQEIRIMRNHHHRLGIHDEK